MSIPCPVEGCGGIGVPTQKDGRFYTHRGSPDKYPCVYINVPHSFVIPKCTKCGTDMFTEDLQKALVQVLEEEYQRHAGLIRAIVAAHTGKAQ